MLVGMSRKKRLFIIGAFALAGLVFLFFCNPANIESFPRCPFLVLTGYKCPGCGTLRGIHSLLNFRFLDAWHYNPLMVVSIPLIITMLMSSKARHSVVFVRSVFVGIVLYWVLRNIL